MSVEIPSIPVLSQQPRSRATLLIAWIVILGLAGVVVYGNARSGGQQSQMKMLDVQRARMFGMLIVQMKTLEKAGSSSLIRERIGRLIQQLEEDARTPEDKIRIAIIVGETLGAEEALSRLSSITPTADQSDVIDDVRWIQAIYSDGVEALLPGEREDMISRHGYLGRLALAHGVPADQEPRKTIEAEAFWFTLRLSILAAALVALMLLSVGAFIAACIWFFKGRIQPSYRSDPSSGPEFLEGFALYLALFLALGVLLSYFGPVSMQWSWIALLILPVVWMWIALRGTTAEHRRQALGWHTGKGVLRELGAGIGGYVAGLVVIALGILLTVLLVQITGIRTSSPVVQELAGGPWRVAGLYALACVFAPFIEETMFRGVLFHHMRRRWSWAFSALIVSTIFALLHPQGWVAAPALCAIAMVLAALREWRGSIIAPMAAHACSNFIVLTMALLLIK